MEFKSLIVYFAIVFYGIASLLITLSFLSPYWLIISSNLIQADKIRLGLWKVCYNKFRISSSWYSALTKGCWWICTEDTITKNKVRVPGFFIATQVFFSVTFCLILLSLYYMYLYLKNHDDNHVQRLLIIGIILVSGGISGFISVVIFGAMADGHEWILHWKYSGLGWAYVLGVLGILMLFPTGILFCVKARILDMQGSEASLPTIQEKKTVSPGHADK